MITATNLSAAIRNNGSDGILHATRLLQGKIAPIKSANKRNEEVGKYAERWALEKERARYVSNTCRYIWQIIAQASDASKEMCIFTFIYMTLPLRDCAYGLPSLVC